MIQYLIDRAHEINPETAIWLCILFVITNLLLKGNLLSIILDRKVNKLRDLIYLKENLQGKDDLSSENELIQETIDERIVAYTTGIYLKPSLRKSFLETCKTKLKDEFDSRDYRMLQTYFVNKPISFRVNTSLWIMASYFSIILALFSFVFAFALYVQLIKGLNETNNILFIFALLGVWTFIFVYFTKPIRDIMKIKKANSLLNN